MVELCRSDSFLPLLNVNDSSLFELQLDGRHVTGPTLSLIAEALKRNTQLQTLSIGNNGLRDDDVAPIVAALKWNVGLKSLVLSGNEEITNVTGEKLIALLTEENHTLSHVALDGTAVEEALSQEISFLMELNKFPNQLKPMAFRAVKNDPEFFDFELSYDPSDVKTFNEESAAAIVKALEKNTTVRTLRLDRCCRSEYSIKQLQKLVACNSTLTRLSLKSNMLGDESARMLCDALAKNGGTHLEELDLGENEISDVGGKYFVYLLKSNSTLRVVNLHNNPLQYAVSNEVRTGTALNCEPPSLKPLLAGLAGNDPTIQELDLSGRENTGRGPAKGYYTNLGAATVAAALKSNTSVVTLNLSNNHIGPDGAKELGALIKVNSRITALDISSNPLFDEGARHILGGLERNDVLVVCDIRHTGCSNEFLAKAAAQCHLNAQPLPIKKWLKGEDVPATLNLSKTEQPLGKWSQLHSDSIQYIHTVVRKNPHVREIDVSDNELGDEGVLLIADIVRENLPIEKLVISNNNITDESVVALTEAVAFNYTIRNVQLAGNLGLSTRPLAALQDALLLNQFPPAIKDLVPNLQRNVGGIEAIHFVRDANDKKTAPFGDDTARILFDALKANTVVKSVSLVRHDLSNRAVGYLCECLSVNSTITFVDVSHNNIGPDGAATIGTLLEHNTTLTSLSLSHNRIREQGAVELLQAMKMSNRTLRRIDIAENKAQVPTEETLEMYTLFNCQPIEFRRQMLERIASLDAIAFEGSVANGRVEGSGCRALRLALALIPNHVTSIDLRNNNVDSDALRELLAAIAHNKKINSLNVSSNGIDDTVAEHVIQYLSDHRELRILDLSENPLSQAYAERIALLIALNQENPAFRKYYLGLEAKRSERDYRPLTKLELPGAEIRTSSLDLLFNLLQPTEVASIEIVNLSNNLLDDDSAEILASSLAPAHGTIKAMLLQRNNIGGRGLAALTNFVWASSSLGICELGGNPAVELAAESVDVSNSFNSLHKKMEANKTQTGNVDAWKSLQATKNQILAGGASGADIILRGPRSLVPDMTLEENKAAEKALLDEALAAMPKRTPYTRGMYANKS